MATHDQKEVFLTCFTDLATATMRLCQAWEALAKDDVDTVNELNWGWLNESLDEAWFQINEQIEILTKTWKKGNK